MATDGEDLDLYSETSLTSFAFGAAVVVTSLLKPSLFPNTYPFGIHSHHINKPTEISALYSNIRTLLKYPHFTKIFVFLHEDTIFPTQNFAWPPLSVSKF